MYCTGQAWREEESGGERAVQHLDDETMCPSPLQVGHVVEAAQVWYYRGFDNGPAIPIDLPAPK